MHTQNKEKLSIIVDRQNKIFHERTRLNQYLSNYIGSLSVTFVCVSCRMYGRLFHEEGLSLIPI